MATILKVDFDKSKIGGQGATEQIEDYKGQDRKRRHTCVVVFSALALLGLATGIGCMLEYRAGLASDETGIGGFVMSAGLAALLVSLAYACLTDSNSPIHRTITTGLLVIGGASMLYGAGVVIGLVAV